MRVEVHNNFFASKVPILLAGLSLQGFVHPDRRDILHPLISMWINQSIMLFMIFVKILQNLTNAIRRFPCGFKLCKSFF